ncbi:alpha/beta fold hydrolase [Maribacter sp. PR1]|uniref:Alpha/beta fold hydrolase n=1 Tax=Maribacter cobaltidurans TaxID=1178778 RepID=A0ABU7IP61_9FLAO|nr:MULTISPECIES: alpha/beta fold hydrolase [Maribacter]MDC6387268.1 alpha/beta fold hydrolase [Maribacter sp. PR1]MEE1974653.1 alpha/beta fold hydrolase [Maribacter cobaltidurans]
MNPILYSNIIGTGEPLCILHGFLGMSDNWKTLGTQYAENGFEVHLLDQRNHGRSFQSADFNYDLLAKDLLDYLNDKKIDKATIIGHSMGGKTAMQFACSYPEKTKKLLVADIAPRYYPPHHQDILNALNSLDLNSIKSRSDADQQLGRYLENFGVRQFLLKNLYRTKDKKFGLRMNLRVLSDKMEEIGENISSSESFNGPTLFLKGSKSEYVSEADTAQIKRHFPNARIEVIENAGHWLHAENPTQFFEKSLRFFQQ